MIVLSDYPRTRPTTAHTDGLPAHSVAQYNDKKSHHVDCRVTSWPLIFSSCPVDKMCCMCAAAAWSGVGGGAKSLQQERQNPSGTFPSWGGKTVGSVVSVATLHTLLSPISDCLQFAWKPLASPLHLQLISSAPQVLSRAPSPLNRGLVILQRSPQKKAPASLRSDHSLLQQVEPPARTDPASPERRARACVRARV